MVEIDAETCAIPSFVARKVTSGHPPYLRSLPLKRLQQYTKAYGLKTSGAIEKEDFVQTILKARTGPDGCLPPEAEVSSLKPTIIEKVPFDRLLC